MKPCPAERFEGDAGMIARARPRLPRRSLGFGMPDAPLGAQTAYSIRGEGRRGSLEGQKRGSEPVSDALEPV